VIIHDFHVIGVPVCPAKADPPLVIDPDVPQPFSVTLQRLQPIAGRDAQFVDYPGRVQLLKFASCRLLHVKRQATNGKTGKYSGCLFGCETADHGENITLLVNNGKRYVYSDFAGSKCELKISVGEDSAGIPRWRMFRAGYPSANENALPGSTFPAGRQHTYGWLW
jgi:hypothetical protein